jgi:hypothetical protein
MADRPTELLASLIVARERPVSVAGQTCGPSCHRGSVPDRSAHV